MESIEIYWEVVSYIFKILTVVIEGVVFGYFIRPFMSKNTLSKWAGIIYITVMVYLALTPRLIYYPRVIAIAAVLLFMYITDRRNILQKVVLAITMYLIMWIAHGIALLPRNLMFSLVVNTEYMTSRVWLQLGMFAFTELMMYILKGSILYALAKGINKVYVDKRENVSGKEFLMLFSELAAVLVGCLAFSAFSDIYEADTGFYIWNEHREYRFLELVYQMVSCVSLFTMIVVYQRIKKKQKEEKENIILSEQMENIRKRIDEVEKLYSDIRGLRHDMGNHIQVLEQLFLKNEKEELERYFSELKDKWRESASGIKSGNPVTDIILTQKQKEALEKGIDFQCDFHYPLETRIEAFDVGVILNNGLENAIRGVEGCAKPYIKVRAYRHKNAYMIEIENCISKQVRIDKETGIPASTKDNQDRHGFGLINIRRIVQKYYGDIDIEQDEKTFLLSIMLMLVF